MGPFLRGFCSELTKVAADVPARSGSSARGTITGPVRGSNVILREREDYRPSPTYTPKAHAVVKPVPAKKKSSGGAKIKNDRMPWGTGETWDMPGTKPPTPLPGVRSVKKPEKDTRGVVNDNTTNRDLFQAGTMTAAAYNKLDPREQTSSHVNRGGTIRGKTSTSNKVTGLTASEPSAGPMRDQRTTLTAKQVNAPAVNPHTGNLTPRGEYEQDMPTKFTRLRQAKPEMTGAERMRAGGFAPEVSRFMPGGGDGRESANTWQRRTEPSQFAPMVDVTKKPRR